MTTEKDTATANAHPSIATIKERTQIVASHYANPLGAGDLKVELIDYFGLGDSLMIYDHPRYTTVIRVTEYSDEAGRPAFESMTEEEAEALVLQVFLDMQEENPPFTSVKPLRFHSLRHKVLRDDRSLVALVMDIVQGERYESLKKEFKKRGLDTSLLNDDFRVHPIFFGN